ncbi:MAG: metal ABC transporter permease [Nitrospinota bacterium]|nr:metal ABC transporter permease [Nitrospinota bacterium]
MIYDLIVEPFIEFSFMRRSLIGCFSIALGASPVGVFLMLRRMSLTGDAIAHAILPGAAVGYLVSGLSLTAMTLGGLIAGMVVVLLTGFVTRTTILREDTSLASFYLISLALGVLIVTVRGTNVDLMHVLFGTILALDDSTLFLLSSIATVSIFVLALFYRPLIMECLDSSFLKSVSPMSGVAHFLFLSLTVLNLVAGFHALGTLLSVGVMIIPAAAARFWSRNVQGLILISVLFSLLGGIIGLLLSYHFDFPTGPTIILIIGLMYIVSILFGRYGSLLIQFLPRTHLEG